MKSARGHLFVDRELPAARLGGNDFRVRPTVKWISAADGDYMRQSSWLYVVHVHPSPHVRPGANLKSNFTSFLADTSTDVPP